MDGGALPSPGDQARQREPVQVLGHVNARNTACCCELADRELPAFLKDLQQAQSGRVAQERELARNLFQ